MRLWRLFFFGLLVFGQGFAYGVLTAVAATTDFYLDRKLSSVRFELDAGALSLSGRFTSYSGDIKLTNGDFATAKIRLNLDASQVDLDPIPGQEYLSPAALFQAIPEPRVRFESLRIVPNGKNRFHISGRLHRGKKQWMVSLPAVISSSSVDKLELRAQASGEVLGLGQVIPLQIQGRPSEGQVNCKLVFTTRTRAGGVKATAPGRR